MKETTEKKRKNQHDGKIGSFTNAALTGAANDVVQTYGSANKEFLVAYSGIDNETGKVLNRSLKEISEYKINPEYEVLNIRQQAGFSAEVAYVARVNANIAIKKGYYHDNGRMVFHIAKDDAVHKLEIMRTEDHPDFISNHPVYDHVWVLDGMVIHGLEEQMKFVNDPKELFDKIATGEGGGKDDLSRYLGVNLTLPSNLLDPESYKKFCEEEAKTLRKVAEKLREKNTKLSEQSAEKLEEQAKRLEEGKDVGLREYCKEKAKQLHEQADIHEKKGEHKLAEKERQQAENYQKIDENIRDSGISTKEAIFYREHPGLAIAKDIVLTSHKAGLKQAKTGAVISGSISLIKNIVAVIKGKKKVNEAALSVVIDTGSGAITSYAIAFAGSSIKGLMQNAKNTTIRTLSKTNTPAAIVNFTIETCKTLMKLIKGEIDGLEFLEELGEKGTAYTSAALFATLGEFAIPIPVIGGMIGSMLGYALSSAGYGQLTTALKEAKIAKEERIQIEAECAEAIRMIQEYRAEMEVVISKYLSKHISTFQKAFDQIESALKEDSIDNFIKGVNEITVELGGKPQFSNFHEFEIFMNSNELLKF